MKCVVTSVFVCVGVFVPETGRLCMWNRAGCAWGIRGQGQVMLVSLHTSVSKGPILGSMCICV